MVMVYIRWDVCEKHWEGHCKGDYHLLEKLERVPENFKQRVGALQKILDKGTWQLVRKYGPVFTGKLPLDVFRPYLKDRTDNGAKYSAPERLPVVWEELEED